MSGESQGVYGERYTASILVLTGLPRDPNGRWLETLGPALRAVSRIDDSIHQHWQALSTRDTRDERDAWSTSQLTLLKRRDCLNRSHPAWQRRPNITQGTAVMVRADCFGSTGRRRSAGNRCEAFPVWEEVGQRNQEEGEQEDGMC